jgi:hypothetical protein
MKFLSFTRRNGRCTLTGRAMALLSAGLLGLLIYLGADPEAHERFHHDADQGDHECVITAFAAGEAYYIAPVIEVRPQADLIISATPAVKNRLPETPSYRLLPSCGPPART